MSTARPNVRVTTPAPVYALDLYRMQERLRGDVIGSEPDAIDRQAARRSVLVWLGATVLVGLVLLRLLQS